MLSVKDKELTALAKAESEASLPSPSASSKSSHAPIHMILGFPKAAAVIATFPPSSLPVTLQGCPKGDNALQ